MPANRQQIDVEEIAPGQFLVRNIHARPVLKGEGEMKGQLFVLGTWRREGLVARLRERALTVSTLADQIAALPRPPRFHELGQQLWYPLSGTLDNIGRFDPQLLIWWSIETIQRGAEQGVALYENEPIRRRKGRGRTSFYRVAATRSGSRLEPINETLALLLGYAIATQSDQRALIAERQEEQILLPDIELPPDYRSMLQRIIGQYKGRPIANTAVWPHTQALYEQLGLKLVLER